MLTLILSARAVPIKIQVFLNLASVLPRALVFIILKRAVIQIPNATPRRRGKEGRLHESEVLPLFYRKGMFHVEQVITLIQTVGFPIACAVAMFMMLNNEQKAHKEESQQLTTAITDLKISFSDAINDQRSEMVNAINNNTLVIQKLIDKMEDQ